MRTSYDESSKEIRKGSVVKYLVGTREEYVGGSYNADGVYTPQYKTVDRWATGRITRLTSKWANIGAVWGGKVYQDGKMIPLDKIVECEAEWYEAWTKTDQYRCM